MLTFFHFFFTFHVRKSKWATFTESGEKGVGLGEGGEEWGGGKISCEVRYVPGHI